MTAAMKGTKKVIAPMADPEYEAMTIQRALAGDHEAGREALRLCRAGLDHDALSKSLGEYLAQRLWEIDKAIEEAEQLKNNDKASTSTIKSRKAARIEQALLIAKGKKPRDPIPDWQTPLAAFGTILLKTEMRPEKVYEAMSEARARYEGRALERKEAFAILKAFQPMQAMTHLDLLRHAGPLRVLLPKDIPQT
jgi:hypothetical protein